MRDPAKLDDFALALSKQMVPWAPLSSTVLALAALWRCWWSPSRVLWLLATKPWERACASACATLG